MVRTEDQREEDWSKIPQTTRNTIINDVMSHGAIEKKPWYMGPRARRKFRLSEDIPVCNDDTLSWIVGKGNPALINVKIIRDGASPAVVQKAVVNETQAFPAANAGKELLAQQPPIPASVFDKKVYLIDGSIVLGKSIAIKSGNFILDSNHGILTIPTTDVLKVE